MWIPAITNKRTQHVDSLTHYLLTFLPLQSAHSAIRLCLVFTRLGKLGLRADIITVREQQLAKQFRAQKVNITKLCEMFWAVGQDIDHANSLFGSVFIFQVHQLQLKQFERGNRGCYKDQGYGAGPIALIIYEIPERRYCTCEKVWAMANSLWVGDWVTISNIVVFMVWS